MKFGGKGALGIAISVACLYLAFHNVEWSKALATARDANYWLLLLSAATATLMFPLRARRWRTILDPVGPSLPFGELWRATAIGMMVNNVVPLRAGEFARAYALSREEPKITLPTALASLVVDRVFDAIVVLLLLAVSMVAPDFPAGARCSVIRCRSSRPPSPRRRSPCSSCSTRWCSFQKRSFDFLNRWRGGLAGHREARQRNAPPLRRGTERAAHAGALPRRVRVDAPPLARAAAGVLAGLQGRRHRRSVVGDAVRSRLDRRRRVAAGGTRILRHVRVHGAPTALGLYGISQSDAATWALLFHVASLIPITLIGAYYFARMGLTMSAIGSAATSESSVSPVARVSAQAKLNLLLRVLAREASGYHSIETVFLRVDLADEVVVRVPSGRSLGLSQVRRSGERTRPAERNLAYRAARRIRGCDRLARRVSRSRSRSTSRSAADLVGGSADAGAVLRALDALSPQPARPRLVELATPLGADVPFMTIESPMALAWGRGERLLPLHPLDPRPSFS